MATGWLNRWPTSVALAACLAAVYAANRPGTTLPYDTVPNALMPWLLTHGHGVRFDALFGPVLAEENADRPHFQRVGQSVLSAYPPGAAFLALPLSWPQMVWLDARNPGWDRDPAGFVDRMDRIAKRTSAGIAALAAFMLHRWLLALGASGGAALAATSAVALGSEWWAIASQAAWQHGPATLCLVAGGWAWNKPAGASRSRILLGGAAFGAMVWCRLPDAVLALVAMLWAWRNRPGERLAPLFPPLALGAALVAYNWHFYGHPLGGQARIEATHAAAHGVAGSWTGAGLAGTLFSPNRGLFVFTPWVALALCWLPAVWRRTPAGGLARWLAVAVFPFWLLVGGYSAWWGGHCFGPRYWTEAMPLFALPLALGWDHARRPARYLAAGLVAASIGIQALGTLLPPSDWNLRPANVDLAHERLWDWRDTELRRRLGW